MMTVVMDWWACGSRPGSAASRGSSRHPAHRGYRGVVTGPRWGGAAGLALRRVRRERGALGHPYGEVSIAVDELRVTSLCEEFARSARPQAIPSCRCPVAAGAFGITWIWLGKAS